MKTTQFDLRLSDRAGGVHVARVVNTDGHDWHLHAVMYGTSFAWHCHSWQAVERHIAWLKRHTPDHRPAAAAPRHGAVAAAITAALCVSTAAVAFAQSVLPSSPPVAAFVEATRDYAAMHRRLEQQIGPIDVGMPIDDINRNMQALAAAIRAERRDAKQGDLFTPALARELRIRINDALFEHDFTAVDVLVAGRVEGIDYERIRLQVNGTFPWILGVAMFPCLIEALPSLPPELQYRIVGQDLLLIDVHASLIVDILPAALAEMTVRAAREIFHGPLEFPEAVVPFSAETAGCVA